MAIYLPGTAEEEQITLDDLTPREIVAELDKYVIGQNAAKRAVAIALRNRMRRQKLAPELAEDVGQHVFDIDVHLLDALIGDDFKGREISFARFNLDLTVVELAFAQLLAKFFAGARLRFTSGRIPFEDKARLRRLDWT